MSLQVSAVIVKSLRCPNWQRNGVTLGKKALRIKSEVAVVTTRGDKRRRRRDGTMKHNEKLMILSINEIKSSLMR